MPEFNFKRDVFPYPEKNNQSHTFQNTIDREGSFVGRCAELCGTYHSGMNFEVRALNQDRFDRLHEPAPLDQRGDRPAVHGGRGAGPAGRGGPDCGELCSPTATTTSPFDTDRTRPHLVGRVRTA